jgi:hypothetical protein
LTSEFPKTGNRQAYTQVVTSVEAFKSHNPEPRKFQPGLIFVRQSAVLTKQWRLLTPALAYTIVRRGNLRELGKIMKSHVLALAALAAIGFGVFAAPVLASETFYIVLDNNTGKCFLATTAPSRMTRYTTLGSYETKAAARRALAKMKQCK